MASGPGPMCSGRMVEIKGRAQNTKLTNAGISAEEALDYAPGTAQRLARRCWPGPITLVGDDSPSGEPGAAFAAFGLKAVSPENAIGLRVPVGDFGRSADAGRTHGPLAVPTSRFRAGRPAAEDVLENFGEGSHPGLESRRSLFRSAFICGPGTRQTFGSPASRRGSHCTLCCFCVHRKYMAKSHGRVCRDLIAGLPKARNSKDRGVLYIWRESPPCGRRGDAPKLC